MSHHRPGGGEAPVRHSALGILHSAFGCPVGRAAQAAVCKTAKVGATPARDSNSTAHYHPIQSAVEIFQYGEEPRASYRAAGKILPVLK